MPRKGTGYATKPTATPEQMLEIQRMKNYQTNKGNTTVKICKETAQADLSQFNMVSSGEDDKEVQYLHMFDSRWSPGMIEDAELERYIEECIQDFQTKFQNLN